MTKRPFPSRVSALESIDHLASLAVIGLKELEKRHRLPAPHVRRQIAETKRGLVALAKSHDWRVR